MQTHNVHTSVDKLRAPTRVDPIWSRYARLCRIIAKGLKLLPKVLNFLGRHELNLNPLEVLQPNPSNGVFARWNPQTKEGKEILARGINTFTVFLNGFGNPESIYATRKVLSGVLLPFYLGSITCLVGLIVAIPTILLLTSAYFALTTLSLISIGVFLLLLNERFRSAVGLVLSTILGGAVFAVDKFYEKFVKGPGDKVDRLARGIAPSQSQIEVVREMVRYLTDPNVFAQLKLQDQMEVNRVVVSLFLQTYLHSITFICQLFGRSDLSDTLLFLVGSYPDSDFAKRLSDLKGKLADELYKRTFNIETHTSTLNYLVNEMRDFCTTVKGLAGNHNLKVVLTLADRLDRVLGNLDKIVSKNSKGGQRTIVKTLNLLSEAEGMIGSIVALCEIYNYPLSSENLKFFTREFRPQVTSFEVLVADVFLGLMQLPNNRWSNLSFPQKLIFWCLSLFNGGVYPYSAHLMEYNSARAKIPLGQMAKKPWDIYLEQLIYLYLRIVDAAKSRGNAGKLDFLDQIKEFLQHFESGLDQNGPLGRYSIRNLSPLGGLAERAALGEFVFFIIYRLLDPLRTAGAFLKTVFGRGGSR